MRGHVAARAHVGEDVGATEGVNGLFWVANQQQRGFRLLSPDTAENTVLLRVGILEFINHRYRKTLANGGRQRIAAVAVQGFIETTEHVIKTQLATTALLTRHRFSNFAHRLSNHQIGEGQRRIQQPFDSAEQRVRWHLSARFGAFGQERLAEFFQRIGQLVVLRLFLRPTADFVDPFALVTAVKLAPVDA